jgi:hypothetical protein
MLGTDEEHRDSRLLAHVRVVAARCQRRALAGRPCCQSAANMPGWRGWSMVVFSQPLWAWELACVRRTATLKIRCRSCGVREPPRTVGSNTADRLSSPPARGGHLPVDSVSAAFPLHQHSGLSRHGNMTRSQVQPDVGAVIPGLRTLSSRSRCSRTASRFGQEFAQPSRYPRR